MIFWAAAYPGVKAFTLIEVLLTFVVIAVLAAFLIPATSRMNTYAAQVKATSNMRQIGVAAQLYANDHSQHLPGHPANVDPLGPVPDQWPTLFCTYLSPSDPRVFLDARDPVTNKLPMPQVISNQANNTAFVYNGFDELGEGGQSPAAISPLRLSQPASIALLGLKAKGSSSFCVDLLFQPLASLLNLLDTRAFDGGSQYLFVDGSVRFLPQAQYSNSIWQIDKGLVLPPLPLP